jgi:hypothetical protein
MFAGSKPLAVTLTKMRCAAPLDAGFAADAGAAVNELTASRAAAHASRMRFMGLSPSMW